MKKIKDIVIKCPNCNRSKRVILKFSAINKFNIYICNLCQSGFTYPIPNNLSKYYHSSYWVSSGILGKFKKITFNLFHKRRKHWLKKYLKKGRILEIGAGEGDFIDLIGNRYETTGIEFPSAKIKNKNILKTDYLNWQPNNKFDAVIFWESLEHVAKPLEFLKKSYKLLKNNGVILIEVPRFDSFESKLFKKHWFHLDPPRHLSHLTNKGQDILLNRSGYRLIEKKSVLAYEYVIWGFLESMMSIFAIKSTDHFKKNKLPFFFILFIPLIAISTVAETILFLVNQSPITFIAAKKQNVKTT